MEIAKGLFLRGLLGKLGVVLVWPEIPLAARIAATVVFVVL